MTGRRIRQAVLAVLYGISGVLFALAVVTDRLWLWLPGVPFLAVTVSAIHEFGHAAGCALNKNSVTGIHTALFTIEKGHFSINEKPFFGGYCGFLRSKNDALVYLCGPAASLVCFLCCLLWWLRVRPNTVAMLSMAITLAHAVKNSLPFGNHDLSLALKEMKKGEPNL